MGYNWDRDQQLPFNDGDHIVSKKEYEEMKDRILFLCCLEEAGVDNWEGFSDAIQLYNQYKKE